MDLITTLIIKKPLNFVKIDNGDRFDMSFVYFGNIQKTFW